MALLSLCVREETEGKKKANQTRDTKPNESERAAPFAFKGVHAS